MDDGWWMMMIVVILYTVYIYIYPVQVTKYNTERNGEGKPQVPTKFDISNHIYIFMKKCCRIWIYKLKHYTSWYHFGGFWVLHLWTSMNCFQVQCSMWHLVAPEDGHRWHRELMSSRHCADAGWLCKTCESASHQYGQLKFTSDTVTTVTMYCKYCYNTVNTVTVTTLYINVYQT